MKIRSAGSSRDVLQKLLEERIAIIDGAMGTTIRTYGMTGSGHSG